MRDALLFRFVICLVLGLTSVHAGELRVPSQFTSIQAAIDSAKPGDSVIVSAGLYTENIVLKSGVTVQGCGADACVIQGDGSTATVVGNQLIATATIDGFTITGGAGFTVPWSENRVMGGGVFADASNINIGHNHIITNRAQIGGGIALMNSRFNIVSNTISSNQATTANPASFNIGGGIYLFDSTGEVSGNQILDNIVSSGPPNPALIQEGASLAPGGGISVVFSQDIGDVKILSNRIERNTSAGSQNYGGGIYLFQPSSELGNRVFIVGNRILDNSGLDGGGIASVLMSPVIVGNLVNGNTAHWGGGIYGFSGNGIIAHNVVGGNSSVEIRPGANTGGGGLLCDEAFTPFIAHNTFRGNTAKDYGGAVEVFDSGSSAAVLWKNLFDGNSARFGGAVVVSAASPNVVGNYFYRNVAVGESGGGLFVEKTPFVSVTNNIFASNRGDRFGGGIGLVEVEQADLKNNTIHGNTAGWWGGGVYMFGGLVGFYNNNVSSNGRFGVGVDGGGAIARSYNNYYGNVEQPCYGCSSGTGEVFLNPGLTDTVSFRLKTSSAIVDSGNPAAAFNDLNGSRNDIGAYGGPDAGDIPLPTGSIGTKPSYDPATRTAYMPNTDLGVGGKRVSITMRLTQCAADPGVVALKLVSATQSPGLEAARGVFYEKPYLVVPSVSVGGRDYDAVLSLYSCASDPGGIYGKLEALSASL